jgi:hypothetical protein
MDGGVKRLAAVERHLSPLVAVGASSSGAPRRLRLAHLASYFHRNYKAAPAADILTHFEAFVDAHRHAARQLAAAVTGTTLEPAPARANGNVFRRPPRPISPSRRSRVTTQKNAARAPQRINGNARRPFVYLRRTPHTPNRANGKIRRYRGRWRPFDTGPISGHYGAEPQNARLYGAKYSVCTWRRGSAATK